MIATGCEPEESFSIPPLQEAQRMRKIRDSSRMYLVYVPAGAVSNQLADASGFEA